VQQFGQLLDHLVGSGKQRLWNRETERFCGPEIDNELILGRRLHRHIGRLLALQDAIDVSGGSPNRVECIGTITIRPPSTV